MSASQLTPKANPLTLLPEKSLPPPPPSSASPTDDNVPGSSRTSSYNLNTIKALPPRPTIQRSWTEHRPAAIPESSQGSYLLAQHPRSKSSGNTASSFLDLDSVSPERQLFASTVGEVEPARTAPYAEQRKRVDCKCTQRSCTHLSSRGPRTVDPTLTASLRSETHIYATPPALQPCLPGTAAAKHAPILTPADPESSPIQAFYSPCLNLPDSPQTSRQSIQLAAMSSGLVSASDRRAPRPSLPAEWKSAVPNTPPRLSSVEAAKQHDLSTFPSHLNQHDNSGQSSPASQRLSSHHAHFSSDYSIRNSASTTHTSIWTERSLPSCGTSPACTQHGLKSEDAGDSSGSIGQDAAESTEELDESSVGLGITSDIEYDVSSRRSSAAPVLPSPMLPGSVQALQGPFSHHRAPSWTRRVDISPLVGQGSQYQPYDCGHAFGAPTKGGLRALGLGVGNQMQRVLSDVTPVSSAASDMAAAVALASSSSAAAPSIPLRRDSRIRCSSDSAKYHATASNPAKHSPSLSISSSASNSGRFTPAFPSTSSYLGGSELSTLQSPPRTSSLRQSPSITSLRGSPALVREGSQRTPPARRPSRPTLDRIATLNDLSSSIVAVQQPQEADFGRDSPSGSFKETHLRTTSAASRSRRVSDVSINSFLQNGEFNHIGAYTSRMRWEEGLYDFDESAETDGDESRAVKTAEEGSATIVQGRDLTLAQIEAETGPNTTHLLLSGNQAQGLLEVLDRVLPLTTNLLVLDLSNCGLQQLPDTIGSCIALEELDVSGNAVGQLPDWILNLRALRTLSADSIGLHHLPSSLIQLQELQRLSLRNNQLVFLPSWLHRMSKLTNLFVEGNHFRGPWQDIVAPLLSQQAQQLQQQLQTNEPVGMHTGLRRVTEADLTRTQARPSMPRMRSANDMQTVLNGQFGVQTPPVSTPDFQSDDSGYVSQADVYSRPTTGYEDRVTRLSCADEADPQAPGGGKWGGFLKKIGRKASSHKLASAFQDSTTSPSESRFSSPKVSRKSLRSSGRASRSNSVSKGGKAPFMTPSQSEPLSPSAAFSSLNLAAVIDEHRAPMTPLDPPSEPVTPSEPTMLLQPIALDAEAKKARRKSFLPVHAFAAASAGVPQVPGQTKSIEARSNSQEMDEESLAQHRSRLRALMHYLRDLDDLTAARTEAASFVGPSKSNLAHLRDSSGNGHSRSPSMHRAESSNPSTKSRDSGGEYVASTAASSISEGASSSEPRLSTTRYSKDDSVRRFRIIAEIVSTERTYVKGLSELVDIYVKPAMAPADGNSGVPVIPPSEHRAVFGNVEALLQFHRTVFLPSLVAMASPVLDHDQDAPGEMAPEETAAVAEKVASVFSTHAAFFKMYTSYINNCDSAQNRISAWMALSSAGNGGGLSLRGAPGYSALQAFGALSAQQGAAAAMYATGSSSASIGGGAGSGIFGSESSNLSPSQRKKIKTFMKRCRTHPRHTQLNVESYLLLPVQRIPRYRLLLEDLVKSTDTTHLADSDALATALEHVTQIASKVNESKRQSEQDRRLLAWQYRIRGPIEGPLVQPHRRLLKDGSLQLKRVVRRIPGFVRSNRSASVGGPRDSNGALSPLSIPGQDHVLSADHLQQVTEDQSMALILCSDVAVLCAEQTQTKTKDPNAPVLLRSMLKLIRPVEILGGVNLRVVDRSEILYLAAGSPEEAVAWKTAFDLHFYQ